VPLGTELGLGPSDIVLDGDPARPPPKRGHSPQFSAMSVVTRCVWMDYDATCYGGRP